MTNLAEKKKLTVCMDNSNPVTSITYGNPQFFDRDTLFINKNTPITLTARDEGSSVLKTEYSINKSVEKSYTSPYKIPEEGTKNINFFSTDKVNNQEIPKTSYCFVDNTPPEIYVHFSIEPISTKQGLNVYSVYSRMYVAATDKMVGTNEILYSVNGSPLKLWSSQSNLDKSDIPRFSQKSQKYSVKIVAIDRLGNTSDKTVEFLVSDK